MASVVRADEVWQRLAIGGPDATDSTGEIWKGVPCPAGSAKFITAGIDPILKVNSPALANMCYAADDMEFSITNLSPGTYPLQLLFIDPQVSTAGVRLFDVFINGQAVSPNVDVAVLAGGVLKPVYISYYVPAPQGVILIRLVKRLRNAILSGLKINILADTVWTVGALRQANGQYHATAPIPTPAGIHNLGVYRNGLLQKDFAGAVSQADYSLDTANPLRIIPNPALPPWLVDDDIVVRYSFRSVPQ